MRPLGRGGNGEVWEARDASGASAAIKLLSKVKSTAYQRFRDEVHVMTGFAARGVVPVLDSELPDDPTVARPWYAMPLGVPLTVHLKGATPQQKVDAVAAIADTLAGPHSKGIARRDIKPANLLYLGGIPAIGDFGLVDCPDKADVTAKREEVGPRRTMAPEVRRAEALVDARPADVCSLAKTLWILLVGEERGFEGQYSAGSTVGISRVVPDLYFAALDEALTIATDHDADRRPSMVTFAKQSRDWLRIEAEFFERNPLEWAELQSKLFPVVVPTRAEWQQLDQIITVLNVLGARSNMNHMFFPDGGGLDLNRAARSTREAGCVELSADGLTVVIRPQRLMFESFGVSPEWHSFRLEAAELEPSGVYENESDAIYEEVAEIGGEFYAERWHWDENEYNGEHLPLGSRVVMRYLRGAFVIFQKTSTYNRNTATYDGRHARVDADKFRRYIEENIGRLRSHGPPP